MKAYYSFVALKVDYESALQWYNYWVPTYPSGYRLRTNYINMMNNAISNIIHFIPRKFNKFSSVNHLVNATWSIRTIFEVIHGRLES
jgi:hypothetical protein